MVSDDCQAPIADLDGVRVAVVTSVPFFLVTQLKQQLTDLHARGAHITTFTAKGPELTQIECGERLRHMLVDIRRRPAPWHDLVASVRMAWLFRRHKFQIVHSTTPKAGLLTALAGWLTRVPIRLHTFTGQPWVTMSGPLRWISRASDQVIGLLNTRCYADSPSQRAFLVEQGIISPQRIDVIGSGSLAGVDTSRFDPDRFDQEERARIRAALGIASDAPVLVFIGRVTRDKGIGELLTAFRALRATGSSAELVLVGPQETGKTTEEHALRPELLRSQGVHTVGYSDRPEQYLAIADILCLPSYREGFGTVVIEAAAMAVPTVGTLITGLNDAVVDGQTGLLVPPYDSFALEQALRRLLDDPPLRLRLGKTARTRCLREFDARVLNRLLADEYVRLLKQAGIVSPHV